MMEESSPPVHPAVAVIFLDCDGVLNASRSQLRDFEVTETAGLLFYEDLFCTAAEGEDPAAAVPISCDTPFEKQMLSNFKSIFDRLPFVKVVLSTTWREDANMRKFLLAALADCGIAVELVVIGDTPHSPPYVGRGGDVKLWLDAHPEFQHCFVIIDDSHEKSFADHGYLANFVKTVMRDPDGDRDKEGLTREAADRVVALIKKQLGIQ